MTYFGFAYWKSDIGWLEHDHIQIQNEMGLHSSDMMLKHVIRSHAWMNNEWLTLFLYVDICKNRYSILDHGNAAFM